MKGRENSLNKLNPKILFDYSLSNNLPNAFAKEYLYKNVLECYGILPASFCSSTYSLSIASASPSESAMQSLPHLTNE
jgi:hypothetical protein